MATSASTKTADRILAKVCETCPVCRQARRKQAGLCYDFVKGIDSKLCPFCKAYERVHGRKSHEPLGAFVLPGKPKSDSV